MGEVNPIKETLLLGVLNIGLPTVDVYSDIGLTYKLYTTTVVTTTNVTSVNGTWTETTTTSAGHPIYASSLLIPFMINYVLGWRAWYYGDLKKSNNNQRTKITWIYAFLGCYPQLVSVRIIFLCWKQPKKALKKKKHLERNVMENEIFTEAVPTTLIMTFLMAVLVVSNSFRNDGMIHPNTHLLAGCGNERHLFKVTFFTSALSAGLGLAKCLKVG